MAMYIDIFSFLRFKKNQEKEIIQEKKIKIPIRWSVTYEMKMTNNIVINSNRT